MYRNMPKNRSGSRGGSGNRGNRNFSGNNRSQTQPFQSSGPLVNDHLQLHELDLELALLKRKREIIETQQNMLSSSLQLSQSNFDEPSPSFGQQFNKPSRSFVDYYDEAPGQQSGRFDRQPSFKRSATDDVWESNQNRFPGSKRQALNSGPQRSNIQPRVSARPAQNANRKPGLDTNMRGRPPVRPRSRGVKNRTNFKPTQNVAPNKLNTYPTTERKNFVAQTAALVQPALEQYILDPNNPIHHKVLGRLELSLGAILRELKDAFGSVEPYVESLQAPTSLRNIKQGIRDRLRSLMMGKIVGPAKETIEVYRQRYPKSTDEAFLKAVLESHSKKRALAIEIYQSGNPETYFKKNFTRLLSTSLDKLFAKVQSYQENDPVSNAPLKDLVSEILSNLAVDKNEETFKKEVEETQIKTQNEVTEKEPTESETKETDVVKTETDTTNDTQENNAEKSEQNDANMTENTEMTTTEEDNTVKAEERPAEETETAKDNVEETGQKAESTPTDNTTETKIDIPDLTPDDDGVSLLTSSFKLYTVLAKTLIEKHLPVMLPKYKSVIMKMLNNDEDFKTTKAHLLKTTDEKIARILERQQNTENDAVPAKKPKRQQQTFVKIVGRPGLPKKKLMKGFLDSFHPTLIKRHRRLHNILFVAFDQSENLENICAKNGITITNCKLDIRVSDKMTQSNGGGVGNNDDVEMVNNDSVDKIIDDSLDDQINDLLSSLRQEEESQGAASDQNAVKTEEVNPEVVDTKEESQHGEEKQEAVAETADLEATGGEGAEIDEENALIGDEDGPNEDSALNGEGNDQIGEENAQIAEESVQIAEESAEKEDDVKGTVKDVPQAVEAAKTVENQGTATPTRASARLATGITTRRASKKI